MHIRRHSAVAICTLALASTALVGCSSSTSTSSTSGSGASSGTLPSGSGAPWPTFTGANAQFCNALIAWGKAGQAWGDARMSGDVTALQSARQAYLTSAQTAVASMPASAPAELKSAFSEVIALTQSNASSPPATTPNPSLSAVEAQLRQALQSPYLNQECPTS